MTTRPASPSAEEFLSYIDSTPTPFHLCAETIKWLDAAGFRGLSEADQWSLQPGDKCYYTRNASTLVAFVVGKKYMDHYTSTGIFGGIKIVGAHTDSPVLKLKPTSKKTAHGYVQVAVECYGGGLWHTWFDRELTVAGSVIVESGGSFERRLVHVSRPLLRVPNLCIHLQSGEERKQFAPNKENHLVPILSMVEEQLNNTAAEAAGGAAGAAAGAEGKAGEGGGEGGEADMYGRHAPELLRILAEELGCAPKDIVDLELSLCDTQPGQLWGLRNEFLSSPRLDNQAHCYTSVRALIDYASNDELIDADTDISLIALFDHEEVRMMYCVSCTVCVVYVCMCGVRVCVCCTFTRRCG